MLFAVPFTGIIKVSSSQVIWGLKNYRLDFSPRYEETFPVKSE
jgi:hypothetical protein